MTCPGKSTQPSEARLYLVSLGAYCAVYLALLVRTVWIQGLPAIRLVWEPMTPWYGSHRCMRRLRPYRQIRAAPHMIVSSPELLVLHSTRSAAPH